MSSTFFFTVVGCDAVFFVIGDLFGAAAVGFAHRAFHRPGDAVGVHDDAAIGVTRGATDGLDQRGFRAQEPFLVGIQNCDQPAFGDVQPLAQQVDPDQHIKRPQPQIAQDFDPFHRVDIRVHVADLDALFMHVFGQILGHAFGQRGAQRAHSRSAVDFAHFVQQIIDLGADGADFDRRVQQPRGADHLFGEHAAGLFQFPFGRGGGHEHGLRAHGVPFFEFERAVVHAGRQAEAVFGQREFAAVVAFVHAADLRDRDVGFICKNDGVVGDEFKQCGGRFARCAPRQVAGIVFDAVAHARRLEHFKIEVGALFQPLRLEQFAIVRPSWSSRMFSVRI